MTGPNMLTKIESQWVFTLVLALSAILDLSIAVETGWYLQTNRTGFEPMDHLIDVLLLYTFNNASTASHHITSFAHTLFTGCPPFYRYRCIFDLLAGHA